MGKYNSKENVDPSRGPVGVLRPRARRIASDTILGRPATAIHRPEARRVRFMDAEDAAHSLQLRRVRDPQRRRSTGSSLPPPLSPSPVRTRPPPGLFPPSPVTPPRRRRAGAVSAPTSPLRPLGFTAAQGDIDSLVAGVQAMDVADPQPVTPSPTPAAPDSEALYVAFNRMDIGSA
ncbi:hypothetical protein EXIGLDRAFT_794812 [Exidia glandulosa HHB12029]|uniref:Uncharacterized protein n=1 Tax=Exidia glandulosa HHB12029 TaxID=1314781 RepID=A0A165G9X8_EXIGL|nr:hypothetical protein EXIGLDRAFT_794812 [Exidia glandulosa HHB12029]